MGKFGKKNIVSSDMSNYMIGIIILKPLIIKSKLYIINIENNNFFKIFIIIFSPN